MPRTPLALLVGVTLVTSLDALPGDPGELVLHEVFVGTPEEPLGGVLIRAGELLAYPAGGSTLAWRRETGVTRLAEDDPSFHGPLTEDQRYVYSVDRRSLRLAEYSEDRFAIRSLSGNAERDHALAVRGGPDESPRAEEAAASKLSALDPWLLAMVREGGWSGRPEWNLAGGLHAEVSTLSANPSTLRVWLDFQPGPGQGFDREPVVAGPDYELEITELPVDLAHAGDRLAVLYRTRFEVYRLEDDGAYERTREHALNSKMRRERWRQRSIDVTPDGSAVVVGRSRVVRRRRRTEDGIEAGEISAALDWYPTDHDGSRTVQLDCPESDHNAESPFVGFLDEAGLAIGVQTKNSAFVAAFEEES